MLEFVQRPLGLAFRKADVEVFRQAADRVLATDPGAGFAITTNFRTDGALVDWVGARFEEGPAAMCKPTDGDYQADFQALVASKAGECAERPVLVLRQGSEERVKGAGANRALEARGVARLLAATFRDAEGRSIGGRLDPDGVELELGGVAVVARTTKVLAAYAAALAAEGLPYVSEGGGKLFETEEVRTALLVLSAVVAPGRETAVVGALRSVWCGLADDALRATDLAWTVVRPPILAEGPGRVEARPDASTWTWTRVSLDAVAAWVVGALDDEATIRQTLTLTPS